MAKNESYSEYIYGTASFPPVTIDDIEKIKKELISAAKYKMIEAQEVKEEKVEITYEDLVAAFNQEVENLRSTCLHNKFIKWKFHNATQQFEYQHCTTCKKVIDFRSKEIQIPLSNFPPIGCGLCDEVCESNKYWLAVGEFDEKGVFPPKNLYFCFNHDLLEVVNRLIKDKQIIKNENTWGKNTSFILSTHSIEWANLKKYKGKK